MKPTPKETVTIFYAGQGVPSEQLIDNSRILISFYDIFSKNKALQRRVSNISKQKQPIKNENVLARRKS